MKWTGKAYPFEKAEVGGGMVITVTNLNNRAGHWDWYVSMGGDCDDARWFAAEGTADSHEVAKWEAVQAAKALVAKWAEGLA